MPITIDKVVPGGLVFHEHTVADIEATGTADATTVLYGNGTWAIPPGAAGGETNTASNVGTSGVGIFKQKTGVDLEFKKINAGSNKITVTDDTDNSELDIDIAQVNLSVTASQVSDFDTEVSSNADVSANTSARHAATTVADTDRIDLSLTGQQISADINANSVTYSLIQQVSATDKLLGRVSALAGNIEEIAFTDFAQSLIDDADAGTARTTLGLVIGTNVQAYDATLTSIALLGTAADKIAYTTAVDTWAETAITTFGRSLIDDTANTDARTTLGLGTMAVETATNYALLAGRAGGQTLLGGTGSGDNLILNSTSHATKGYVLINSAGGNVGIGTTAPEQPLGIDIGATTDLQYAFAIQNSGTTNNGTAVGIGFSPGTGFNLKGGIAMLRKNTYGRGDLVFLLDNTADASPADLTDEKMRITTAGYVGIGTPTPAQFLDVAGNIALTGNISPGGAIYMLNNTSIAMQDAGGTSRQIMRVSTNDDLVIGFGVTAGNFVGFYPGGSIKMAITSDGSVGIGTATPSANSKLDVRGGMYSTGALGWQYSKTSVASGTETSIATATYSTSHYGSFLVGMSATGTGRVASGSFLVSSAYTAISAGEMVQALFGFTGFVLTASISGSVITLKVTQTNGGAEAVTVYISIQPLIAPGLTGTITFAGL